MYVIVQFLLVHNQYCVVVYPLTVQDNCNRKSFCSSSNFSGFIWYIICHDNFQSTTESSSHTTVRGPFAGAKVAPMPRVAETWCSHHLPATEITSNEHEMQRLWDGDRPIDASHESQDRPIDHVICEAHTIHRPVGARATYRLTGTKPSKSKYRSCVASRSPAREVRLPIRQLRGFRRRQTHSTGGPTYSIQEEAVLPRLVSQPSHIHVTRGHMTCSACAYREAPATWQVRMAKSSCTQLFHAMWMLLGSNSLCLGLLWDHEAASIRFWRASQSSVGIGCAAMLPLDGIGQIDHMMANCKYISFQQSRYLN